jgi:hypothetical protein
MSGRIEKPRERISKLDAARRQLKTAVRMFFDDGDTVSVHTLAAAAHEILRDLQKVKGGGVSLKDLMDLVVPERRSETRQRANAAENFFKHADRDPDEILDFKPLQTEFLLFDAFLLLERLTGRSLRAGMVFGWWFLLRYPELAKPPISKALEDLRSRLKEPTNPSPSEFLPLLDGPEFYDGKVE